MSVTVCAQCAADLADSAKFCSECGTPVADAPGPTEQRRTVTALFCDLSGSTALGESVDPEALRAMLARYYEQMRVIIERHGGSVEKFIGDAVMAVFGVPVIHEDDALRACRAALEMRDAFPGLQLNGRLGVNTGEVVIGLSAASDRVGADRLATGDAINVAARLEQAAATGEVLIGSGTRRLLRSLVEVGERRELTLKGKQEPVGAYPLLAVVDDPASARRLDVPIVGRQRELRLLNEAWERACTERSCQLFTVLGDAGVGKSRLVLEFLAGLRDVPALIGRSFSYGEGITYSPVLEMLTLTESRPSDPRAATVLATLLGERDDTIGAEEIAWAFRRLLEELSPVVCVFDDIHWSEETLLDLIDHIADWSQDAPILVLCLARPELLDHRTGWAGGKLNATTVLLEALNSSEADELVTQLLGEFELSADLRGRILASAQGNPLFVEEMLAMATETDRSVEEISVPPTVQALLAARLGQLDRADRTVLERGAVEGQVFHLAGVAALEEAPDAELPRRAMTLVRKQLVRPERAQLSGEDAFRFRHMLIRDAAYDGLPKAVRADLHERFAAWLEARGQDLPELDEIAGYHLEQAHRYRVQLGLLDARTQELGERAAERLRTAADRALLRNDASAAVSLYRRLLDLAPAGVIDCRHESRLVLSLLDVGRFEEAETRTAELARRAAAAAERGAELLADVLSAFIDVQVGVCTFDELDARARALMAVAEPAADDDLLAIAWLAISMVNNGRCRWAAVGEAAERAAEHARRCRDLAFERHLMSNAVMAHLVGPTPVAEARAWLDARAALFADIRFVALLTARLTALEGDIEAARRQLELVRERELALGSRHGIATATYMSLINELTAGDAAVAVEEARNACVALRELGQLAHLSTTAGFGARACLQAGDDLEAARFAEIAEETGSADDVITQSLIGCARGTLAARRGDHAEAERLIRAACALLDDTDMPTEKAEARVELAEALLLAGRRDQALAELDTALALFEAKGVVSGERSTRRRRAQLLSS